MFPLSVETLLPEYLFRFLPLWFTIFIIALWAVNKFMYPFFDRFFIGKENKKKLEEYKEKIDKLTKEYDIKIQDIKDDYKKRLSNIEKELKDMTEERNQLKIELSEINGSLKILRDYFKENKIPINI